MLCRLGWHRWRYSDRYGRPAANPAQAVERTCARCGLAQYRPPPYALSTCWLVFHKLTGPGRA